MKRDSMIVRFSLYGFLKNLRFYEPFIILAFREQGLSFLQIGLLYSIRDVTTNVLEIPSGLAADAFGRIKSMLFSLSAYIISFLIFFFLSGFWAYALAMMLFALGEAFRTGTHKALILEYLNRNNLSDQAVHYYGQTRAASQFGSAINALLAAALVFYSGNFRYVFIATTLPYIFNLINLAAYPRELDGKQSDPEKTGQPSSIRTILSLFFKSLKDRGAQRALLNSAGFTAFFKSVKDYMQPVLQMFALSLPLFLQSDDTKRTALIIGVVYFIIYLMTSTASRFSGQINERFKSSAHSINTTFLAGAIFLFAAGFALQMNLAIISIIVLAGLYVLQNIRKPITVAFISDQLSHSVMASGLSVESQLATLLTALFSPLIGLLADRFSIGMAFLVLAVIMLFFSIITRVNEKNQT